MIRFLFDYHKHHQYPIICLKLNLMKLSFITRNNIRFLLEKNKSALLFRIINKKKKIEENFLNNFVLFI